MRRKNSREAEYLLLHKRIRLLRQLPYPNPELRLPLRGATSDYANPYSFTGRELDILDGGALQIMNYRHRYYDTYTGRFLTNDPLAYIDGMNLYEYVGANPLSNLDPSGTKKDMLCKCFCIDHMKIAGGEVPIRVEGGGPDDPADLIAPGRVGANFQVVIVGHWIDSKCRLKSEYPYILFKWEERNHILPTAEWYDPSTERRKLAAAYDGLDSEHFWDLYPRAKHHNMFRALREIRDTYIIRDRPGVERLHKTTDLYQQTYFIITAGDTPGCPCPGNSAGEIAAGNSLIVTAYHEYDVFRATGGLAINLNIFKCGGSTYGPTRRPHVREVRDRLRHDLEAGNVPLIAPPR